MSKDVFVVFQRFTDGPKKFIGAFTTNKKATDYILRIAPEVKKVQKDAYQEVFKDTEILYAIEKEELNNPVLLSS